MLKYTYPNAIVYVTEPTEKQLNNIRSSTERYLQKLLARGVNICGRDIDGD